VAEANRRIRKIFPRSPGATAAALQGRRLTRTIAAPSNRGVRRIVAASC
jgi:hypothetical protein